MYQTTHHPSFLAAKSLCKLWVMTTKNDTCDLKIGMFLATMVFGPICFRSGRMRRRRNWRSWHHLKHLAAKSTMKTMDRCERQQDHPCPDRRPMTWNQSWKRRKMSTKSWSKGPGRSCTQKIKTKRQSILECKGKICKTGWQARALQGGGPGVTLLTLLPVVLQGDLPVWAVSIAVSAGSLGSEGELVCALFAVDCFWDYRWRDQWADPATWHVVFEVMRTLVKEDYKSFSKMWSTDDSDSLPRNLFRIHVKRVFGVEH